MKIGIVGATGLVGEKLRELLETSLLPIEEVRLIASERSKGKKLKFKNEEIEISTLSDQVFANLNLVFFMASSEVSKEYVDKALKHKCVVIDNSSYYRMHKNVPLIIPEVNFDILTPNDYLIANPNCSTIQLALCLYPLSKINEIKRVDVSTYQAISGAGKEALIEFNSQTNLKWYNAIPQVDAFTDSAYTKEELKVIYESQKILQKKFAISCTAVRIPVEVGHSESVTVFFENEVNLNEVLEAFNNTEGIIVLDDIKNSVYPLTLHCLGKKEVFVGRIRKDYYDNKVLHFWNVADNLLKGAAANALQIAEKCFKEKLYGW